MNFHACDLRNDKYSIEKIHFKLWYVISNIPNNVLGDTQSLSSTTQQTATAFQTSSLIIFL